MPPPTAKFPLAAKPKREIFDPWNSSATGHQRAENRLSGSTSWRDSRSAKLAEQFRSGASGGRRVADTVGAGSESFEKEERTANGGWKRGVVRDRATGQISLWESFGVKGTDGRGNEFDGSKRRRIAGDDDDNDGGKTIPERHDDVLRDHDYQVNGKWHHSLSQDSLPSPPAEEDDKPQFQSPVDKSQSSAESYDTSLLNSVYGRTADDPSLPPPSGQPIFSPPTPSNDHAQIDRADSDRSHLATGDGALPSEPPQIFRGLTVYINGSTYPTISDHKLKHLLVTHGANISIALGRRSVTHVILGRPAGVSAAEDTATASSSSTGHQQSAAADNGGGSGSKGAGGGLAASKIQKEIARVRSAGGKGVRYVGAEWVLACVEAGRRVGEGGYEVLRTGPAGVKGVHSIFGKRGRAGPAEKRQNWISWWS